ncbi:hypothetical protein [Leptospira alexanderi]|uniref:hypothetical protein n=1 Tax=Leptospira alexanderi TaxID=100053 RepID=UPI0009910A2E|nr:hypothetical protein [Leptospira alexanderi]
MKEKEEKSHIKSIALIKNCIQGFSISTSRAIFMAEREGIIPIGKYKRSTVDRLLIKYGFSTRLKTVSTGK